ncbi:MULTISPECIES: non-ribosomal peptide synthetase [Moorena]|uniref:Amino acid adenylation domain protein n=1 Tax=Moorena producens 3L TaxID=489825 RepID=F4Y1Y9_9CYAN|nr:MULTISPECIES: non-ribosomal peptide synthetase [Moorena]AEE88272.1 putative nonribosomal peptide synthetase [Moorena producens 3L]EGJ29281.1 amino acid adenylation domain protein [Moorena producens 3L]NEP67393.1 amino acid adenylation domain-containing protein [Moorena sp. SIO3A5]OLT64211.1 non-ribosomal peptide synthetase [Moorena producens 3L]
MNVNLNNQQDKYRCIPQLFEAQVERTPEAVAVIFADQQLTYRALNTKANQLAHHLQTLGVEPEVLVGICVERSVEMVVGLLAILKAGGAYVPLDPAYPPERLAYMLDHSQASVLLTQNQLVSQLPKHQANVICLDTDWEIISTHNEQNPTSSLTVDNLAYIIYTSGSTGKPKGVAMPHRSLVNLIKWQLENTVVDNDSKTLQFAPISFDVSFQEIFSTWCAGGTLVLISSDVRRDPVFLLNLLAEQEVARLFLPFVALQQIAEVADTFGIFPASLREVITAGEQLQITPAIANLFEKLNDCTLHNHYGPSESHVVTSFTLKGSPSSWPALPAIGRPIANTQIYLLDQSLKPVPAGVEGELYIGGVCLARGYLNRPEITAQRFIANPFNKVKTDSDRLYKTGDLAHYLPDGNIQFLGRLDDQVKIRGYRIELGEIEVLLSQHPNLKQAVVLAREDNQDKRLVAYLVPGQSESVPVETEQVQLVSQVRNFLQEQLPDYMIPAAFVVLEALPLTPSGKVDRRALPPPNQARRDLVVDFVAPRTPTEEILASIWAEVLGLEEIGIYDNFFHLGGDSIQVIQLLSRIRNTFSVELPLHYLFEDPTIAKLSQKILGTTSKNNQLLPPIKLVNKKEELPLSFPQQRLWFLEQLEQSRSVYNEQTALHLRGCVDVTILEQVLTEIVNRHQVMRSNVKMVDGSPVMVISPHLKITLPIFDLQQLTEPEQFAQLQQLAVEEAQLPFDLAEGLLLRVSLLRLAEEEHVLLLTIHHIIWDGWSMAVFIEELSALYSAFYSQQPSPLPELPIQYRDFASWQRQWFTGEVLENQLNYWKQQLAGIPALLELPTDRPRPPVQTHQGSSLDFEVNGELTEKLKALSQASGATLYMTLLAAWATLLYRYSSQEDIAIGSPIANRTRPEMEPLIGFFANIIVLRNDLSGNPSFLELLARVRSCAMDAYANQDVPCEQLVEVLKPERSLSHSNLFQVMFVFQQAQIQKQELASFTLTPLSLKSAIAKFDLTLLMEETGSGIEAKLEYNSDLFDQPTIVRIVGHFQTLLEGIVANPQAQVSTLPLLTAVERQQLLVEWNNTDSDYPQDKCVHQLFEQQVEKTPDAVAVVCDGEQLTYKQLNQRANQLAHHLLSLGVRPEALVGICVERSIEMVVGLLGILKAGGAYVPLDSNYPAERLSYILADSGVEVLLTQQELLSSLPSHTARVVCLDSDWGTIEQHTQDNLELGVGSDNLAYAIYTSGSTGQPKGVLVEHKNVVRLFAATQSWYHFNANDVWTNFHSIAFDFSVWEIWGALFYGGRLVIVPYWISRDPQSFYDLLCSENVTVLNQTPSAFRQLIQVEQSNNTQAQLNLRLVIFGGEALDLQSLKPWFEQYGDKSPQLVNMYGITETTVHVTYRPLTINDLNSNGSAIGCPIPDLQMYILDENLQPVPIGVTGQMYVGGAGVTRGYLNREHLNNERFIPNPFNHKQESRLYKTGDLARYMPNGDIEYKGRIDNQVKIRGFRIELGEIEAVLGQHPAVGETVVVTRKDQSDQKRLVAYIVSEQEEELTSSQLRQFLKQKLPDYMIPSGFVFLEKLPLTANGKVDLRALPELDTSNRPQEAGFVSPRNSLELQLSQIWCNLLNVHPVGVKDNFFDLGGHSLLAVDLMARIKEQFGTDLPLATLFTEPTIENQASLLVNTTENQSSSPLVPINKVGNLPALFCVHPVGGNVLCYAELARYLGDNQPFYGLQSPGLFGESEPLTRIEDMASCYIETLQTIQPVGPYYLGGWSNGGIIAWEMAQQLSAAGEDVALLALIDSYSPVAIDRPEQVDEQMLASSLAKDLGSVFGTELSIAVEELKQGGLEEQLQHILREAKGLNILPPEIGIEQMRKLFGVFQANLMAMYRYQPQPYSGRIALFCARELEAEDRGWHELAVGGLETYRIPGDHYTMMRSPHVEILAKQLELLVRE